MRALILNPKGVEPNDLIDLRDRIAVGLEKKHQTQPIMLFASDEWTRFGSAGGWRAWIYHAAEARMPGGKPTYDVLIALPVSGVTVGRATAQILERALATGRPAFAVVDDRLRRVRRVVEKSGDSWRAFADLEF